MVGRELSYSAVWVNAKLPDHIKNSKPRITPLGTKLAEQNVTDSELCRIYTNAREEFTTIGATDLRPEGACLHYQSDDKQTVIQAAISYTPHVYFIQLSSDNPDKLLETAKQAKLPCESLEAAVKVHSK